MRSLHILQILIVMLIFGSSYPVGKIVVGTIDPFIFSLLRILIMSFFLLPFLKTKNLSKTDFLHLFIFGISMGIGVYVFMYLSLHNLNLSSHVIIIMQLSIPIGVTIGMLALNENVKFIHFLLIFFAICGVFIAFLDSVYSVNIRGLIYGFIASFSYGIASYFSRKLKNLSALNVNAWMCIFSFPVILIFTVIYKQNFISEIFKINLSNWFLIFYSAVIVSLLAQINMVKLYQYYDIKMVLPFYSLFPIFGIFLSIILLNEPLTVWIFMGTIIVLLSNFCLQKINYKNVQIKP